MIILNSLTSDIRVGAIYYFTINSSYTPSIMIVSAFSAIYLFTVYNATYMVAIIYKNDEGEKVHFFRSFLKKKGRDLYAVNN